MQYSIVIPGDPIAYRAPQHGRGFTYDPISKKKKEVKEIISTLWDKKPKDGIIYDVFMIFFWTIPKSYSKKRFEDCLLGLEMPTKKDGDNCLKFYQDVCQGFIWNNDRDIRRGTYLKSYDVVARTEISWKETDIESVREFGERFESMKRYI